MMKYALNHPWKFRDWRAAYSIGLSQTIVVMSVEAVNLLILQTNGTIMDIIMNFLALVVIAEFDDYFFIPVANEPYAKLISEQKYDFQQVQKLGEVPTSQLLKIEVTTSNNARFRIDGNRFDTNMNGAPLDPAEAQPAEVNAGNAMANLIVGKLDVVVPAEKMEFFDKAPEYIHFKWEQRTCWNKFCRLAYLLIKLIFASVWFYFIPFSSIYLSFKTQDAVQIEESY